MKNIALSRPATSAIAAFLAFSTPVAFAQEAPTVSMTPPVAAPTIQVPAPAPTTTPPVAQTATPPVAPQPVIRVPLDIAPVPAPKAAAPKVAEAKPAAAPVRAERAAARPAAREAAPAPVAAASTASTAPAAEAPIAAEAAPIASPVMAPVEPVTAAPLPVEQVTTTNDGFPWEIAGGAAALLIVGGAGIAFARRRRADRVDAVVYDEAPLAAPAATPVTTEEQPWVTPAYNPQAPQPAMRTTPTFASAPQGSMGRHEATAMAGPTPENPFATLTKRLARARFLDRQERVAYDATLTDQKDMRRKPVSAWEIAQRPEPATAEQEVRRVETGRDRIDTRRPGFARH